MFDLLGQNWLHYAQKAGITYHLVASVDEAMSAHLEELGHGDHCFKSYDRQLAANSQAYQYGSLHYVAATWRKVMIVKQVRRELLDALKCARTVCSRWWEYCETSMN